ncbi:MAG: cation transporter [Candidatus Delongbacteria bacterium]|nr:cation transporter [Candidatus Delongbacteria bacterium]
MKKLRFDIKGMHCASCSAVIELTFKNFKGVNSVSVNLLTNSADFEIDESAISADDIITVIGNLGYKASIAAEGEKKKP